MELTCTDSYFTDQTEDIAANYIHLGEYFSEYALIKYRVQVEVAYFIFLSEKKFFTISANTKKHFCNHWLKISAWKMRWR